jgi:hypothetical protein
VAVSIYRSDFLIIGVDRFGFGLIPVDKLNRDTADWLTVVAGVFEHLRRLAVEPIGDLRYRPALALQGTLSEPLGNGA